MPTYLTTTYQEREQVKALGARWDGGAKRWYVPDGLDPAPFAKWLPSEHPARVDLPSPLAAPPVLATQAAQSTGVTLANKGMSLSVLLAGVAEAVAQAYAAGVWVKVEVAKVDSRRGHVYLELAERTGEGVAIAQARAMIWATTANKIIPHFERITGSVLTAGIKLLVRAKPSFHTQYGFSLVIDEIDPEFTLGELEAKKREIRARLQREGLFDANRRLPAPWDFDHVLVVAPQGAAGLGDFDAEARRLQAFGVCAFEYAHSRFQGEGPAAMHRSYVATKYKTHRRMLPQSGALQAAAADTPSGWHETGCRKIGILDRSCVATWPRGAAPPGCFRRRP